MNISTRWMPAVARTMSLGRTAAARKRALGLAGLLVAGAAVAGPATAIAAAPPSAKPIAPVQQAEKKSDKRVDYQFQAQPNIYYCGPASTRIALSAQGEIQSQDDLATKLGTTFAGTASAFDITRVLNETLGKDVYRTGEIPNDTASADEVRRLKADLTTAIDNERCRWSTSSARRPTPTACSATSRSGTT